MKHKHKKQKKLTRPDLGEFGRNEWAIHGATCFDTELLVSKISAKLKDLKIALLDAEHGGDAVDDDIPFLQYKAQKGISSFWTKGELNTWKLKSSFNEVSLLLINGNHFSGQKQIVVIDSRKEDFLSKHLDQLTDVGLVLLKDGQTAYDFLTEKIKDIPVLDFGDIDGIVAFLRKQIQPPELYGLVLMGGKSIRMGHDKSQIDYHGKPQREYVADLISGFVSKTYLSSRAEQMEAVESKYDILPDTFLGLGPYGGLLSAFQKHPNKAWLVIAVDLPKMDVEGLKELVDARDFTKFATAFLNKERGIPEPLITIWEPRSYPILLSFLAQGFSCPRKVLTNSDIKLVIPKDPEKLMNVNSPKDLDAFNGKIP